MRTILFLSPFNIFPPYWGGASRIYYMVKHLSMKNKIIILCNDVRKTNYEFKKCDEYKEFINNKNIELNFVKSYTKLSQMINPLLIVKSINLIKQKKPDLIFAEFAWSGFPAIIIKFLCNVDFILDEHNVEFIRFKRMKRGNKLTIYMLRYLEKVSCIKAKNIFCCSDVDKQIISNDFKINNEKILVIPNGIDTVKFRPNKDKYSKIRKKLGVNDKVPLIMFFGKMDYIPNLEAIKIIYEKIMPKILEINKEIKFLIVGDNPPKKYMHNNIIYTGIVENIEDYIHSSSLVIAPLISGGGTRIKILESIACGKTVISTNIGAEGLVNKNSKNIIHITDDWELFSMEIIKELDTERFFKEKDCINFIKEHSWEKISEKINIYLSDNYEDFIS